MAIKKSKISKSVVPKEETKSPKVDTVREEVSRLVPKWTLIGDCIMGQEAIKSAGVKYLPKPNAADLSTANTARYDSYLKRAVFYNITRRTLDGMVGQVFSRDPIVIMPEKMKPLVTNLDGAGVGLDQQSRKTLGYVMAYARAGLLTDYPTVEGNTTVAELNSGMIRPTITLHRPHDIINWRYTTRGAISKLELVVIKENYPFGDDGFEVTHKQCWRVLRLRQIEGRDTYTVEVYVFDEENNVFITHKPESSVLKSDGTPWDEITFEFVGILNNNAIPDEPPMYDLATLNIAHYCNSGDYEDSCYMVGQPTPYFTGLTQQWVDQVLKGSIQMGSRTAVPLPQGATAGLLQVNPNSMPFEAMKHKEALMVALGAKLITQSNVQKTLGEAQLNESTDSSILSTATKNVSMAYTKVLKWAAEMYGIGLIELDKVSYSLNTDFPAARLTPAERQQLILEWQAESITFAEMRAGLRRAGVATEDDEKARTDIKANPPPAQNEGAMNNGGNGGTRKVPNNNAETPNNGGNNSGN